ncbi:MAG TPA: glutathione S-transferase N-terminal domain-containing protein [Micropepsaceae bacterium]|nr:glutathione S-transferase N-terminal domain-containing protein [Micropepsaceae bacterium]
MSDAIRLKGAPGSPYTRKMIAYLRYRHIPYRFLIGNQATHADLPKPKVELLPTFYLPNAKGEIEAVVDSTPLIRRMEREHAGRYVLPPDPALAFIDALIEDYADEWLTKAMFHYRWVYPADIDKAGDILPLWRNVSAPHQEWQAMKKLFSERQIGRLRYVGSNEKTGKFIEESYKRFIVALENQLAVSPFLMGKRPGASDFAVYGQLTQLTHFDPTPMALTLKMAPRTYAWIDVVDDLSGLDADEAGFADAASLPPTLKAILAEIGRVYAPFLLANAKAVMARAEAFETTIDGAVWSQQTMSYQAKCLAELRAQYAALNAAARQTVDASLSGTGCEALFAGA